LPRSHGEPKLQALAQEQPSSIGAVLAPRPTFAASRPRALRIHRLGSSNDRPIPPRMRPPGAPRNVRPCHRERGYSALSDRLHKARTRRQWVTAWARAERKMGLHRETLGLACANGECLTQSIVLPAGASGCPVFDAEAKSLLAMGYGWSRRGSHFVCVTKGLIESLRRADAAQLGVR
jgi:hypothetical protein